MLLSGKKFTVSKNFLLLELKCLKFSYVNCFMLQRQKIKCFSVIEVPQFRPSRKKEKREGIEKEGRIEGSEGRREGAREKGRKEGRTEGNIL